MAQLEIQPDLLLDGRLALYHQSERWLAVADTHYGYSEVMRQAGGLFPCWGNQTLAQRLRELCHDYTPQILLINGDLVHGRVCREQFAEFLDHLRTLAPEVILVQGNHDRSPTTRAAPFVSHCQLGLHFFHHGHLEFDIPKDCVEIIGHWHPAARYCDGAGLKLKMPTLVFEPNRWILPAFSPWAGGTVWRSQHHQTRQWVCTPKRVFEWKI